MLADHSLTSEPPGYLVRAGEQRLPKSLCSPGEDITHQHQMSEARVATKHEQ